MSELEEVQIDEVDVEPEHLGHGMYAFEEEVEDEEEEEEEELDPEVKALLLFGGGAILAYLWATRRNPTPAELRERALKENVY